MNQEQIEFEIEGNDGDDATHAKPWDPKDIRVGTKAWSLRQIIDEIADSTIDIAPDFQRRFVWKIRQQVQMIESILLGIPLPAFYFNQNEDNTHQVVDGVQRLTTIRNFANNMFPLEKDDLEYLVHLGGKYFKDLDPAVTRRLHQTQIVVHVIDASSPYELKFNIFKRINTGGTRLEPQEIRHCMAKARARSVLNNLISVPDFKETVRLSRAERMEDRELALRFVAFRRLIASGGIDKYRSDVRFEDFLNYAMRDLDDSSAITDADISDLKLSFGKAIKNCSIVFGRRAFRKNPNGGPLNRALFDCWTSALSEITSEQATAHADKILSGFDKKLLESDFADSVGYAIGNAERIRTRFRMAESIVKAAMGAS